MQECAQQLCRDVDLLLQSPSLRCIFTVVRCAQSSQFTPCRSTASASTARHECICNASFDALTRIRQETEGDCDCLDQKTENLKHVFEQHVSKSQMYPSSDIPRSCAQPLVQLLAFSGSHKRTGQHSHIIKYVERSMQRFLTLMELTGRLGSCYLPQQTRTESTETISQS